MATLEQDRDRDLDLARARTAAAASQRRPPLGARVTSTLGGMLDEVELGAREGTRTLMDTLEAPLRAVEMATTAVGIPTPFDRRRASEILLGERGTGEGGILPSPSPRTGLGRASQFVTESVPIAAAVVAAPEFAVTTPFGKALVEFFGQSALRAPVRFFAGEAAAAAGAGAANFWAEQRFPDDPTVQLLVTLAGGFAPGGIAAAATRAPRAMATGAVVGTGAAAGAAVGVPFLGAAAGVVVKGINGVRRFLTPTNASERAQARLLRADPDLQRVVDNLDAPRLGQEDALYGIGHNSGLPADAPMTLAQRSNSPGMMSLERSVMESSSELSAARQEQFADLNSYIRSSLNEIGGEPVTATAQEAREYMEQLIATRLQIAATRADEAFRALGTKGTKEDLNGLARIEIERAVADVRRQETQLYNLIDPTISVQTNNSVTAFEKVRDSLSHAEVIEGDLPDIIPRLLDFEAETFLGEITTVKELRGLQGKLREIARQARANGATNRARIADNIANAITEDLATLPGDAVENAVGFSRQLNDNFTRGPVGKLLGYGDDGGLVVPPALTLESTIGATGPQAHVSTDALLDALSFAERQPGAQSSRIILRGHMEDFIRNDFSRATVTGGKVDPEAAEAFLDANQDILARFPELRRQLEDAGRTGEAVRAIDQFADPAISRAAVFLKSPPGKEWDKVFNLADPGAAARDLIELVNGDTTGMALTGLRQSFIQRLRLQSETRALDITDEAFISGRRMMDKMRDPAFRQIAEELFSKDGLDRLDQTLVIARRLDEARRAPAASEGVIGDAAGQVQQIIARFGGAQIGNLISRHTGGGNIQGAGIMSGVFRRASDALVHDPAARLLTDAIQNEQLFRALLEPAAARSRAPDTQAGLRRQLNAWLAVVMAESGSTE